MAINKISVLLINIGTDSAFKSGLRERYNYPPYGLLSIASVLKSHGYDVHLIDLMSMEFSQKEFIKKLNSLKRKILAVGITTFTETMHLAVHISKIVKIELPGSKVILGGVHVSSRPEEGLIENSVDYIVRGEGESTIVAILELIKYEKFIEKDKISGISYKKGSQFISTKSRPYIKNLNTLPLPSYNLIVNDPSYSKTVSIISSRGCPGKCIFCASRAYSGSKYRMHSAVWLFSLLYYFEKRLSHINIVNFVDDTFTVNKIRLKKIFYYIKKNKLKYMWACKSRVDSLDEETIKILANAGCRSIHLGVESGDQSVLDSIDKGITLEKCFNIIYLLNKYSIRAECSFMIGLPADTLETIDKTIIFASEIEYSKVGLSTVGIAAPFPGTKMFENAKDLGIIIKTYKWKNYTTFKPVFYTNNFTIQDLRKAFFIYKHDKEKLKGKNIISSIDLTDFRKKIKKWVDSINEINPVKSVFKKIERNNEN